VVGEVPLAPERLRESEQDSQASGERLIRQPVPEEWPVDEMVGDGVRAPPDAQRDDEHDVPTS
jgi:hypothetical protein